MMARLHYTKAALILFGLGLMLGFVAVVVEDYPWLERIASAAMALSLLAIPVALFADGHGFAALAWLRARLSRPKRKASRGKPRRPPSRRKPPQPRATASGTPGVRKRTPAR